MANEVSRNIQELINNGLENRLRKGMMDACKVLRNAAVQKAPKGKTGQLQGSIDFNVESGTEGVVFSNCEYAPYVEVGTGIYSRKGSGRQTPWRYESVDGWFTTEGMVAKPFLEPAVQENIVKVKDCFGGLI